MGELHEKKKKKKKKKKRERKTNLSTLTGSLHYYILLLKEFLLFSTVPIPVEMVTPIKTTIAVRLMVPFAVNVIEDMRERLAFFGGCLIHFLVVHAILRFLSVMFCVVSFIALCTSGDMKATA